MLKTLETKSVNQLSDDNKVDFDFGSLQTSLPIIIIIFVEDFLFVFLNVKPNLNLNLNLI